MSYDFGVTNGTVTVQFDYKLKSAEHTNIYMIVLNGTSLGSYTQYLDGSLYPSLTEYKTYKKTFTTTTDSKICIVLRGTDNAGLTDEMFIKNLQVEQKSHATPFVNGTRSSTQGLLDRTGNSTINLSDVSFDSNAQMTFDGADDVITLGSIFDNYNTPTIEAVFKSNSASGTGFKTIIGWGAPQSLGGGNFSGIHLGNGTSSYTDESLMVWVGGSVLQMFVRKGHGYYHDDNYHHVVVTLASGSNKIYIDGVEETVTFKEGSVNTDSGGFSQTNNITYIGRRPYDNTAARFHGSIPLLKVYNRALTAAEVLQNFNATKSRFGL
jgi:hypothetical protein